MTRKSTAPDSFRLWVDTLRKVPPAFGNVPRKNIPARQPSTFGQFSAKSLASVRKCTPKRRPGQTTSGCLFPPIVRHPKRPAAITRKSTAPDSLRLWIYTEQKASPAFGDIPRKNVEIRQPPAAFFHRSLGLSSAQRCTLKKRLRQTAFGFGSILSKKPCQRSEMCPSHSSRAVGFRL